MRSALAILFLVVGLTLSGCASLSSEPPASTKWTTGFWFWEYASTDPGWSPEILDSLFVEVGTIRQDTPTPYNRQASGRWFAYANLPRELPPANEYWAVYRFERQAIPDIQTATIIGDEMAGLQAAARRRHCNLVGVQLDIDAPTAALARYATFIAR